MKRTLLFFTFLLIFGVFSIDGYAQEAKKKIYQSKNELNLKPKEIKKLTMIQLEGKDEKKFPDSYLLGMRDERLILATDIATNWTDKSLYVKSEVNLRNYTHLTMLNRKEKHRKMAIWGAIFGAAGYYFVQSNAAPTEREARNKILLGQDTNNGVIEGVIGGITGAGFGMIVGRFLAKRRINLRKHRTKAVRKIKEFSFYDD